MNWTSAITIALAGSSLDSKECQKYLDALKDVKDILDNTIISVRFVNSLKVLTRCAGKKYTDYNTVCKVYSVGDQRKRVMLYSDNFKSDIAIRIFSDKEELKKAINSQMIQVKSTQEDEHSMLASYSTVKDSQSVTRYAVFTDLEDVTLQSAKAIKESTTNIFGG